MLPFPREQISRGTHFCSQYLGWPSFPSYMVYCPLSLPFNTQGRPNSFPVAQLLFGLKTQVETVPLPTGCYWYCILVVLIEMKMENALNVLQNIHNMIWQLLWSMNFNNLVNKCLIFFFFFWAIGDMSICISMVKFVLSLTLLIKKKVHNHYNFIKF